MVACARSGDAALSEMRVGLERSKAISAMLSVFQAAAAAATAVRERHNGPATSGDEVSTGGNWNSLGSNHELYATCQANGQFMVKSMHLCATDTSSVCQDNP